MGKKKNVPSNVGAGQFPVVLCQRVIFSDELIWDAEREVHLPIQPFVGLVLLNCEWKPPDFDQSEDPIEHVFCDLKTGRVCCYLPISDYRYESSGCDDWREDEVRERYQGWTLTRDFLDGRHVLDTKGDD